MRQPGIRSPFVPTTSAQNARRWSFGSSALIWSGLLLGLLVSALAVVHRRSVAAAPAPLFTFTIETVAATGDVGRFASLADVAGQPMLAYYDATNGELLATRFDGITWAFQTVDTAGDAGRFASLDLSGGQPTIAYYAADPDTDLRVAQFDGLGWQPVTVDGDNADVGRFASLASGPDSGVAYYDATNGDLKFATYVGTALVIQTIDSDGDVGRFASLAYVAGFPAIAYYDATNGDLKYAAYDGAVWTIETVDVVDDVGRYAALLDVGGRPVVAYYDATHGDLKVALQIGGTWQHQVVDDAGDVGQYASAAVFNGRLLISYYDASNGALKIASGNGSTWQAVTVDDDGDVGRYASLALIDGVPAIGYYDATASALKYVSVQAAEAYAVEKSASETAPDPGESLTYTVVINNLTDLPYTGVAVNDALAPGLTFVPGSVAIVPPEAGGTPGAPPVIATDMLLAAGGVVTVTYQAAVDLGQAAGTVLVNEANVVSNEQASPVAATASITVANAAPVAQADQLATLRDQPLTVDVIDLLSNDIDPNGDDLFFRLETQPATGILTQTVASQVELVDNFGWDVGQLASLIELDGQPAISYLTTSPFPEDPDQLLFASFDGSAWNIETVDLGVFTSIGHPSLALVDGQPALTYAKGADLYFAVRSGQTWQRQIVDSSAAPEHTAVADANGQPIVSYYAATSGDLKYARLNGQTWQVETVDSAGDVGQYTSLAIINDQPAISYINASAGTLKYARFDGQAWLIETVDDSTVIGRQTSLASIANRPAIGYYDTVNGGLKYARFDGQSWQIQTVDNAGDVGRRVSLIEVDGQPALVYLDASNGDLKHARYRDNAWHIDMIDSNSAEGGGSRSLALIAGQPAVAYEGNSDLRFASLVSQLIYAPVLGTCSQDTFAYRASDGALTSEPVAVNLSVECPLEASVAVAPVEPLPADVVTHTAIITNNTPLTHTDVALATTLPPLIDFVPDSVTISPADVGGVPSEPPLVVSGMTLAPGAVATITFETVVQLDVDSGSRLRTAFNVSSVQQTVPISAAEFVTIANAAPVAHADWLTGTIDALLTTPASVLLTNDADANGEALGFAVERLPLYGKLTQTPTWQTEVVTGTWGYGTSVAIIDGRPAIAFYSGFLDQLLLARFTGQNWNVEVVDTFAGSHYQVRPSLAQINGLPAISYFDSTLGVLKYARYDTQAWHVEVVDNDGTVGGDSSLALINGEPAISYDDHSNHTLKYARFDGVEWHIETVDTNSSDSSLAVIAGQPAISYSWRSSPDYALKYARYDGEAWQISEVDGAGWVGLASSLAEIDGQPAISYSDEDNSDLKYAAFDGETWQTETVDAPGTVGWVSSLASIDGMPAIAYYDFTNGDLKYAAFDGSIWQLQAIDAAGDVGSHLSMAVVGGRPAISYVSMTTSELKFTAAEAILTYAPPPGACGGADFFTYRANDGDMASVPVPVGITIECSLDASQTAFPALPKPTETVTLTVVVTNGTGTTHTGVNVISMLPPQLTFVEGSVSVAPPDVGGVTGEPPVIVDDVTLLPGQSAIIRFQATVDRDLATGRQLESRVTIGSDQQSIRAEVITHITVSNAAPLARPDWFTTEVDMPLTFTAATVLQNDEDVNGDYLTFVLESSPTLGTLIEATVLSVDTVDSTGTVGWDTSLAIVAGDPAISYVDLTNDTVKFAQLSADGWHSMVVDSIGAASGEPSLVAVDGQPAISYSVGDYSWGTMTLKVARFTGESWRIEAVGTGKYSSLAMIGDKLAVSYCDGDLLKYAQHDGQTWQLSLVDPEISRCEATSLTAIDGQPAISYGTGDLKYALYDGQFWHIETVDSDGFVGLHNAIALVDGRPAISYYDTWNTALKYARHDGQTWHIETVDNAGSVGTETSLAVRNGQPVISYHDYTNSALKVARGDGANWLISTVDTGEGDLGRGSSIAVMGGQFAVSYFGDTDLRYMHFETWLNYEPLSGVCGEDTITYRAYDGADHSEETVVVIDVLCPMR